jgi:hypothetical protein
MGRASASLLDRLSTYLRAAMSLDIHVYGATLVDQQQASA